ncbi:MAG TPA: zf-HC2 domain-containing protein [Chloroflexia bacterium]|nr:zf-HC2 domain-containing protein [Chloroflexia bacterium]
MRTTPPAPDHPGAHLGDLLPAYVNATLAAPLVARVEQHLATCAACRTDLAFWQSVATAAPAAIRPPAGPAPGGDLLDRIWAQIDARPPGRSVARGQVRRRVIYAWHFLRGQARLLPRALWLAAGPALLVGCLIAGAISNRAGLPPLLGLVAPLITAAGAAFLYGPENDPAWEIALATPAPPRLVLLSRLGLFFGYNFTLALGVTGLLALLGGGNFAPLAALWVGPMLLLTGLSLLLSLLVSTLAGLASAVGLGSLHLLSLLFQGDSGDPTGGLAPLNTLWQTTPIIVLAAAGLLLLAVLAVPRQPRLAEG